MAKLLLLSLFAVQIFSIIANGSKPSNLPGLTIKLIHRDSPDSPLYKPNLTRTQRTKNLILQSIVRSMHFLSDGDNSTTKHYHTDALRFKIDQHGGSVFMAQVGIGTFDPGRPISSMPYFLHVDTGSSLIWTQCEGCRAPGHHCFRQRSQIFPDSRSRSYWKLPCDDHRLCYRNQCAHGFCTYRIPYHDGSSTEGFLASETFTFESTSARSGKETVPRIVFGCGFNQLNMHYTGEVDGLLGLGWGRRSLLNQLGPQTRGRFSYCLQKVDGEAHTRTTLLQFGADIPAASRGLRTTDLVQLGSIDPYFVNLLDISIAGTRLRIPGRYFSRRPRLSPVSGTVVDSGSAFSCFAQPAYEMLERAMEQHLVARFGELTRIRIPDFFRLCVRTPRGRRRVGYGDLPTVTFHFSDNADMVVQPQGVFFLGSRQTYFCLAITSAPYDEANGAVTFIGAYQQTNQRVIYDVGRRKLQFGPEDC